MHFFSQRNDAQIKLIGLFLNPDTISRHAHKEEE